MLPVTTNITDDIETFIHSVDDVQKLFSNLTQSTKAIEQDLKKIPQISKTQRVLEEYLNLLSVSPTNQIGSHLNSAGITKKDYT